MCIRDSNPEIEAFFPDEKVFSMIDVYLEAARTKNILAFPHDDDIWVDVGKPENIALAERALGK